MRGVALTLEDLSIQDTKRSPLQCEVATDTPLKEAVNGGSVRRLVWVEGPSLRPPVPGSGLGAADQGERSLTYGPCFVKRLGA